MRDTMYRWAPLSCLAGLTLAVLAPVVAGAQTRDQPPPTGRPVSVGGEVALTFGPRDGDAFFNYTDYERNALRIARLRLFGEWRVHPSLSAVGELRTEDAQRIEAAGLYVRWQPWAHREFVVQAGRIPPVFGAFPRRAYGRDNLVMGIPLAYQYLTSLRSDALPATIDDLLRMRARGWRPSFPIGSAAVAPGIPLVSGTRWDTGAEVFWRSDWVEAAGAVTLGSPAVPVVRDRTDGQQWSGRVAVHLPDGLTLGASGARATWIDRGVLAMLPAPFRTPRTQMVTGVDLEFGRGRLLVRAEWLRSRFELPIVAAPSPAVALTAWSGFVEARYRLHPRWQVAVRTERLTFSRVVGADGAQPISWDAPVERVEGVIGFRVTPRLDLRAGWQHNWRTAGRVHERGIPAVQVLYWF
jgi:hypothetical protein